ncbi:MAG: hypothetical protein COS36_04755 [Candidatus Altarchaeum sp. CG03_land_8_20_14_0_80_32_618]|nr:hypothetical protein [Candidatus Altarchaeum hamiconexum]OIQ05393.1 MAG: hypothetical protein AUK59_04035 [Candidatus Altarchaeum sp. CG2_30_32_3053]PIV27730.1 MAG: hypothetical protein COS36_04755 [Candidatus Altarchaeum sp. CG03_land_8_20_14_0_80_32_618]PIZ33284.1 MAG: hypothetical protein COY41_00015 [Candidatus Altarchaeum sp. CG_4_10_14_0_8_um_filter_32_851]
MSKEQKFLKAINDAFGAYNTYGARSNKKLIPVHKWFANIIEANLGTGYSVMSLGKEEGKEYTIEGKYYPKTVDISVFKVENKKKKIISIISFKFVTSNYKQNANNYFENLLGETANIRRIGVGFAHFLVLRGHTPYYDKAAGSELGELKKIEILHEKDLLKYVKLFNDLDFPHKPEVLGIAVIDFDDKGNAYFVNINKLELSEEIKNTLNTDLSLANFIKKFIALCQLKS